MLHDCDLSPPQTTNLMTSDWTPQNPKRTRLFSHTKAWWLEWFKICLNPKRRIVFGPRRALRHSLKSSFRAYLPKIRRKPWEFMHFGIKAKICFSLPLYLSTSLPLYPQINDTTKSWENRGEHFLLLFHYAANNIIKTWGIDPASCKKVVKWFLAGHHSVFYLLVFSLFHYWYVPVWHDVRADSLMGKAHHWRSAQSAASLGAGGVRRLHNTSRPSPHALYVFLCGWPSVRSVCIQHLFSWTLRFRFVSSQDFWTPLKSFWMCRGLLYRKVDQLGAMMKADWW